MHPTLTAHLDVALLTLYAFFLFFLGLVFYLRREDRREGYPLEDDLTGRVQSVAGPLHTAPTKSFRLPFGHGIVTAPTGGRDPFRLAARKTERFHGAPLVPTGDPLVDGIGPAAWAERAKRPDIDMEGHPRIVPIDHASITIAPRDPDPRGMEVVGIDGVVAGTVNDLWVDKADRLVRYLQVALTGEAGRQVLVPMAMLRIDRRRRRVIVDAIRGSQFANAPTIAATDRITLYEEDRIVGYFGGGYLYATPDRQEPWL